MSSAKYGAPATSKKKKGIIIGVSSVVLVAMVVAVAVGVNHQNSGGGDPSNGSDGGMQAGSKSITSICQPTTYKEACETALSKAASNTTDPKELMKVAFLVAADQIKEAFNHSSVLQAAEKDPRTSSALENCKELLDYSIDDMKASLDQLAALDIVTIDKVVDDIKVWLSAAVTYQETCLDGFENTTGQAGESMRKALKTSGELTSNVLAIVNQLSSVVSSFEIPTFSRRLLSTDEDNGGFPSWVTAAGRRLLDASTPDEVKPNMTVAQDGSGDYKTINDALGVVPTNSNSTFVIYIKAGVYNEIVVVGRTMINIMMIGDGPTKTKITGNKNFIDGTPTFNTATFGVIGDGFMAKNIGFENTAGAEKHQAVALRVQSDKSVFYNCQMDAYQDTLYAHTKRQFYRECTISGTIDFIFGDSAVVFQNCLMLVRTPMDNQQNIVTAQGRKDQNEPTGIVLHNCTIKADPDYYPFHTKMPSYLGRPWKEFSRTFIMQSQIDDFISPQGWLPWLGDFGLDTCFYAEFDNRGPGSNSADRVTWKGVKKVGSSDAQQFTVDQFIQGSQWLASTGVPYTPGLLPTA